MFLRDRFMLTIRTAALALITTALSASASAQYVSPYGAIGPPAYRYYGCGGIFLELGRQNDDLARIRARLRRLELETDESARARQWISALDAENRNLRQQNVLFRQRVIALEQELEAAARARAEASEHRGPAPENDSTTRKP